MILSPIPGTVFPPTIIAFVEVTGRPEVITGPAMKKVAASLMLAPCIYAWHPGAFSHARALLPMRGLSPARSYTLRTAMSGSEDGRDVPLESSSSWPPPRPPWSRRAAIAGGIVAPACLLSSSAPAHAAAPATVLLGKGAKALEVSAMGVGAWSWGDEDTWGFGTAQGATEESIEAAYRACLQNGITFIDTAEIYGTCVY